MLCFSVPWHYIVGLFWLDGFFGHCLLAMSCASPHPWTMDVSMCRGVERQPQATTNLAPTILKIRSIVVRQTGLPPETTDFALGSDSRNWRLEHQGPSGKQLANSVQTGPAYLTASRILAGLRPMASDRSTSPNAVSKDAFFGTIGTSSQTFPAIKGLDALAVNLSDHVERDLSEKP